MLFTIAAVAVVAAIVIFFSQEFINLFKWIFEIKGAKVVVPLAAASLLIYTFDYWFLWLLIYYHSFLQEILLFLVKPFSLDSWAPIIFKIIVLTFISLVPVWIVDFLFQKRTMQPYPYPYVTITLIWIVSAVLIL